MIPSRPGTYVLFLALDKEREIVVGKLGQFRFPAGVLAYAGSARGPGGLQARLARHCRTPRPVVWHIDALQGVAHPLGAWFAEGTERQECLWAEALGALPGASTPAPGFGASDCRCPTHLFHFSTLPSRAAFARFVGHPIQEVFWMHPLLQALEDAVRKKDDIRAEELAIRIGAELGESALPMLREWQSSPERDYRWWAVRTVAAVGTPEAAAELIAALQDPDPDVRACAVVGLAALHPPEAVAPLIATLSDPSAYVARLAADALARIGAPAVPALVAALQEGDTATRIGAARALSIIGPQEAVPALCAALDDPSALVTYYAEEALDKLGIGMVFFEP